MEPTLNLLNIAELQALVERLNSLEADDDALKDASSKAACLLAEIISRMQAIALGTKPPTEFEWDKDYFAEVSISDRCIYVLRVNPAIDSGYSQSDWEEIEKKEYLIGAIARKKIWDSMSVEVKSEPASAPIWLLNDWSRQPA